jgi:hypothetical protein
MKRAIDLGLVEAAAIKTAGGKIRLRLLFTADQLESMLIAARSIDPPDGDANADAVTQCNAPERDEIRSEGDDEDDAREAGQPIVPPTAPVGRHDPVFVIEGTRAWKAWSEYEKAVNGKPWKLTVRREHQGRTQKGWHFPTLFPPRLPIQANA